MCKQVQEPLLLDVQTAIHNCIWPQGTGNTGGNLAPISNVLTISDVNRRNCMPTTDLKKNNLGRA